MCCDIPGNILIVEDDRFSAVLLNQYIKRSSPNASVTVAADAAEAQDCIKRNSKFTIMFVDVGLPGVDGFELVKKIIKLNNRPTFIIFMSASIWKEQTDIIEKPVKFDTIDNLLTKLLVKFSVPTMLTNIANRINRVRNERKYRHQPV